MWGKTRSDKNSTVACPYNVNGTTAKYAKRFCKLDPMFGAQWMKPDTKECPYKSEATQELALLSKVYNRTSKSMFSIKYKINLQLQLTRCSD